MQKKSIFLSALLLGSALTFSACGDSDDNNDTNTSSTEHDHDDPYTSEKGLEQDGKALFFYSSSTNDHYAYYASEEKLVNLNNNNEDGYVNYNMTAENQGKYFVWIDNKGDDNASNDEEKILMFEQDYTFQTDVDVTYEDFYYLGHYHAEEEEDGETHYHLAAHANEEFDLSNVPAEDLTTNAKYKALIRLNAYIQSQLTVEQSIQNTLSSLNTPATLCGFRSVSNDIGTRHYAMGTDGKLYILNDNYGYIDQTTVASSCEENKMGISAVTHKDESGVLIYEASSQKLYLVDSHDGGVYHVHTTFEISEIIPNASIETMSSIIPVSYEADEDHDDHDH